MYQNPSLIIVALFFMIASCNNTDEETNSKAGVPFKIMMTQHPVADFDTWKPVYLAHDSLRKAYEISQFAIGTGTDDPTMVIVFNKINDVAKARAFTISPNLKEVMGKAGVTGSPTFNFLEVIRNDTTKIEQKDRILVAHRVRDFNTWLKIFDEEGSKVRQKHGLTDRGLARDIDDPKMLYILFAITDKKKAAARINSPELKKIMTEAGVEAAPQFIHFRMEE